MSEKLTKRAIDLIKGTGERKLYWDAEVPGFGLKVGPKGSKTFILQYRVGGRGSPTKRYTIGAFGVWTVDQAREESRRLLVEVRGKERVDVAEVKQEAKRDAAKPKVIQEPIAAVFERFEAIHLKTLRSGVETARQMRADALPVLGKLTLAEVTRGDVIRMLDVVEARGATYARNRLHAHVRKFFAWCQSKNLIDGNPADGLGKLPEVSRDRVLTDAELKAIWNACDSLPLPFGAAVRCLILTAQRREEVGELPWSELDIAGRVWTIGRDRAKNDRAHIVPLTDPVIELIEGVRRQTIERLKPSDADAPPVPDDAIIGAHVFTTTGRSPISGWSKVKTLLDEKSGVTDWRYHDIRRTVATGMASIGIGLQTTEAILNHISGSRAGVAGVYNRHAYTEEKRAALNAWASRVAMIVDDAPAGNVVALRA